MSARHEVFSSSNSLKSEIQIIDFEEDVQSYKSILDDDSSILPTPEKGMATPSRRSNFSKTPRTSRINSTQSAINNSKHSPEKSMQSKGKSVDFEEDVPSNKSILDDDWSILSLPEQETTTPSRQSRIACRLQYIGFSLISMGCAFAVMIIWYTVWQSKNIDSTGEVNGADDDMAKSNFSCQYWELAGDGYCDDEANVPECGYDFNDCCEIASDRSLCQNCTCYISENKIEKYKEDNCQDYVSLLNLGDGYCELNRNREEYFFDVGDCCLDLSNEYSCKHIDEKTFVMEYKYCPENPCIKSNNFCIPEELGDGICQDHNNGPFCDYDLDDCCSTNNYYWEISDSKDCCACFCHEHVFYFG